MKHLNKSLTIAASLFATMLFVACGDSKVSGSDEQANSVNANATIQAWLEGDTLRPSAVCTNCTDSSYEDVHSIPTGFKTEKGKLIRVYKTNFESVSCETEETWFVYSVVISDTAVTKYYDIPDTLSSESFKQDCTLDGGIVVEDEPLFQSRRQFICILPTSVGTEVAPEGMQYFDIHWKKYAQQIIDICGEPIDDEPVVINEDDDVKYIEEDDVK